jgi:hypothetical protein
MPVFYDGRDVRITHRWFQVLGADGVRYAIGELSSTWVVIPQSDHLRVLVPISCSGGSVAIAALVATGPDHVAGWAVGVLVLVMIVSLLARSIPPAGPPPRYQLVAAWRGASVCLYATCDPTEFGQVRRALQRALEWHEGAERN